MVFKKPSAAIFGSIMTEYWKDFPDIEEFLGDVESLIVSMLGKASFPLEKDVGTLVKSGGKMLRPALVYVGGEFGLDKAHKKWSKKERNKLVHIAAGIEMLHTATLIHDDMLDRASHRRGIPTLHQTLGTTNAILAGDWLLARTFRIISEQVQPKRAMILADFVSAICKAEINQDLAKYGFKSSRRHYLQTIAGKTAALFALALHVGAAESGCSNADTQALRRTGYNLGMAFQIIDDILDYESNIQELKKPVGNDIREGLCTLPLIYALQEKQKEIMPLLKEVKAKPELVDSILTLVHQTKAIERAREDAAHYSRLAHTEIGRLPEGKPRHDLELIVNALLVRTH